MPLHSPRAACIGLTGMNSMRPPYCTTCMGMPAVIVYEVFKKVALAFDENRALQAIGQLKQGRVVNVDEAIAIYAGKLSLEKKLPMADALIYATAVLHDATVYTQDAHFEGLAQVRYFRRP